MEKTLNEYGKGRWTALKQMIVFVEDEINKAKSSGTVNTNTPRQITNGGKLKAYHRVLDKLKDKIQKTETNSSYSKPQ